MNVIQSRRRFLGVLSAGAAAAVAPAAVAATLEPAAETTLNVPLPAVAMPSPDAKLLQLFDEYMATVAEYRRVYRLYQHGQEKHQAKHPMPDVMLVRPADAELGLPDRPGDGKSYQWCIQELKRAEWSFGEKFEPPAGKNFKYAHPGLMVRYEPPPPETRARADEIIEAHDGWHDKFWHNPREVRSLERQADRASKRKDKLRAKIDRTRAHTVAGLAAKAQVAAIEGEEDTQFADTTLESILRDIRALDRRVRACGSDGLSRDVKGSAVDEAGSAR